MIFAVIAKEIYT